MTTGRSPKMEFMSSTAGEAMAERNQWGPLHRLDRRIAKWSSTTVALVSAAAGLVIGGVIILAYWLFLHVLADAFANQTLQFAGTAERLALRGDQFTLSDARITQVYGMVFAVIWGVLSALLFAVFWKRCWNAGFAAKDSVVKWLPGLPLAGAVLAIVQRLVTLASLRWGSDGVEMVAAMPAVVTTLAWGKWVLAGLTFVSVLGMIVSAGARASQTPLPEGWADEFRDKLRGAMAWNEARRIEHEADANDDGAGRLIDVSDYPSDYDQVDLHQKAINAVEIDWTAHGAQPKPTTEILAPPEGTGIACSGGGIRAASFTLGALSTLERRPTGLPLADSVLGSARYLASVSGGGYAAAAWRIAAGTGPLPDQPLIGDPAAFDDKPEPFPRSDNPSPDLLTHIRPRRNFLANGTGGLPRSLIRVVVQMAVHLSLIIASVYVLAWPWGKLLGSWTIDALTLQTEGDYNTTIGRHQWLPPLLTLASTAPLVIWRLFIDRTRLRRNVDTATRALVALAAGSAFALVALPFLVELVVRWLPGGGANRWAFTGIWGVIVTAIWQLAKQFVRDRARYLGGILLAVGLGAFAGFVIDWSFRGTSFPGQWPTFMAVFAFLIVGFIFFNPDAWSLHELYRHRLTGTFSTRLEPQGLFADPEPPPMSEYMGAEGPRSIICCAAARQVDAETGIAAVSMTLEPDAVTLYKWSKQPGSQLAQLDPAQVSHREFARLLPGRGDRLASLMGAVAISGAAVAPAMGRLNMSTTNALLAAFNARLGVWVPNPAYTGPGPNSEIDRRVTPRLVNMFKEIFGVYDPKDPNVYATDGGHWDNLGLVELIRRRCDTIIAIDTSGNPPGTYTALKDSIALARHECGAEVSFPADQWKLLEVGEDGLVDKNHMLGTVRYRDGHEARVLYVKGAVARTSSLAIQRYAAGDRTFPNYSTANQMLSDRQLTFLIRLGNEAMCDALDCHPIVDSTLAATPAQASVAGTTPSPVDA